MASERKARLEVDDLKRQLQSRGQDVDRKRHGPDEETLRKIRRLEDTIAELQKNLAAQKQVCYWSQFMKDLCRLSHWLCVVLFRKNTDVYIYMLLSCLLILVDLYALPAH